MRASTLRRWIEKAEENLRVAEVDRNNGYHAAACFHAQQAAELALKALVIFRKGYQPFTHSLVELAKELHDDVLRSLPGIEDLRWLQEHYLQARYPNARMSEYTEDEAQRAIAIGRRVVEVVRQVLEGGGV
jgi:HEPN domain-containing protein